MGQKSLPKTNQGRESGLIFQSYWDEVMYQSVLSRHLNTLRLRVLFTVELPQKPVKHTADNDGTSSNDKNSLNELDKNSMFDLAKTSQTKPLFATVSNFGYLEF